MNKAVSIIILTIFLISCGETEFEINTRNEYSSIIRRIDSNYQRLQDNNQQEENLSMIKSRDFYASYIDKFSEIRDDFAGASQAEKFEPIKTKIDSILALSNQFINNRQSILMSAFEVTNAYSDYSENLNEVINYIDSYDRYSDRLILKIKVQFILQDSIDFYKAYSQLERDIKEKDSLILLLKNRASTLNAATKKLDFKDKLTFHQKVIDQKSILTDTWNSIQDLSVQPKNDIAKLNGDILSTISYSKNPDVSISGVICGNEFTDYSSRNDFRWADNYEWKKNDFILRCPTNDAQRGVINLTYRDSFKEFPVEQGTATFSNEEIEQFTFGILGGRIGVIVKLKELFGEPDTRKSYLEYEELEWVVGFTTIFLTSRDNNSHLLIQL